MNVMHFSNPQNVVAFCEVRLDQAAVTKIIQKEAGLTKEDQLIRHLALGEYMPVLKAIWSERDRSKRLQWLRSHQSEMHAPLLYEQAVVEFSQSPTEETLLQVSFPLLFEAGFRVFQDSQCCQDASVKQGDCVMRMQLVYQNSLAI